MRKIETQMNMAIKSQKNWEWFVSDFQGKNIVDFSNGISISE